MQCFEAAEDDFHPPPLPSSRSTPTLFDYEAEDKVVSQGQSVAAPPAGILIRLGAAL